MKVTELLDSPEKWIRGAAARDGEGFTVWTGSPEAVCWCMVGAIIRCYPCFHDYMRVADKVGEVALRRTGSANLLVFNDDPATTFEMVRGVCEEAGV